MDRNVWYRARRGAAARKRNALGLTQSSRCISALRISEHFYTNADVVKMANMAQQVNVIAPIFTNETGMFKQTIYHPLQLFADNAQATSPGVFVGCKTYGTCKILPGLVETTTQKNLPYSHVSATYNDGGAITNVVNHSTGIATTILSQTATFNGNFKVYKVNGHSFTMIKGKIQK